MFGATNIFETFFAIVKRISVSVMAFLTFYGTGDEPVHELDTFFAPVSVVAERIPAASAQLSLPVVVMDLYPPPRVDHSDFAVGQANETANRTCGDHFFLMRSFTSFVPRATPYNPASRVMIPSGLTVPDSTMTRAFLKMTF